MRNPPWISATFNCRIHHELAGKQDPANCRSSAVRYFYREQHSANWNSPTRCKTGSCAATRTTPKKSGSALQQNRRTPVATLLPSTASTALHGSSSSRRIYQEPQNLEYLGLMMFHSCLFALCNGIWTAGLWQDFWSSSHGTLVQSY